MKVAAIQMRSGVDIDANMAAADALIREAAAKGAKFIATPEMTHILQRSPKRLFAVLQPEKNNAALEQFAALSKELAVDLLIGSMAIKTSETRAVNRSYLFGKSGKITARYDKVHLFDVTLSRQETWRESNVYDRGDKAVLGQIDGAVLGLSICYDLRFGKMYRRYAQMGAHILTVPAAFTVPTGKAHWEPLLRARAIEGGSFVIAPAQGGLHEDGRTTWGHSLIIDPWGQIIAQSDDDEIGIIYADLDMGAVEEARRKIPAWSQNSDFT